MFERYTEKARRVAFFARCEASKAGVPYIDDEHMLLGLIRENKGQLARFLSLDAIEAVERETREHMPKTSNNVPTSVDLPLSKSCQQALKDAAAEAEAFRHRHIGTEHVLLGLLRQQDTLVTHILGEHGLTLAKARDVVAKISESAFSPEAERDAAQHARIDQPGSLEFVNAANDASLAKAELELIPHVPRVGEEVVLRSGNSLLAYRVRDVTYTYVETAEQRGAGGSKLAKVVIRVEPAGTIRGAQWDAMT
jgi:ATP-dependent Clp protease ATP-binding subunit ClpC